MLHYGCYLEIKSNTCPICKTYINGIQSLKNYTDKLKYDKQAIMDQRTIDILSMTNFDSDSKIDYFGVSDNFVHLMSTLCTIPLSRGIADGVSLCESILSLNNTKITIIGENKLSNPGKKVFIANHTNELDFIALFYILKSGYLASSFLNGNIVGKHLSKIIPCLVIDRGKSANTVDKMKQFVDDNGSICLFPEGIKTHPSTLAHFRTGAFNIGYPIYPVVITYGNTIADESVKNFILKLSSKKDMEITIQILNPEYPPFTPKDIQLIRLKMAVAGKLMLSRVSNRDIVDM
jgi:1-acyl-sn-glycerol-3-phosphate acyltransferase